MGAIAKPAVRYLLNILESRNETPELRQSALEVLKEISPDSTQLSSTLISILENEKDAVELRRLALEVLKEISPDSTQLSSTLISILENEKDAVELRRSIIDDLRTFDGVKESIEPHLVKILEDSGEVAEVRLRSVWALRQLGKTIPDWVAEIRDDRIEIRQLNPVPEARVETEVEGLNLEMVKIPAGNFEMGSPDDEKDGRNEERPRHEVTIAKPFWMGKYPVTQAQWKAVAALPQINRNLNPNPSKFEGDNLPVEYVSWYDAEEFCARLATHTQRAYRLPTEAEWEYACRANTTTLYHFGENITPNLANFSDSGINGTTPVGYFAVANPFGLYDMHGNVWEWCADHWHENYEGAPIDGSAWLTNNEETYRLLRGGSWYSSSRGCRSAYRYGHDLPDGRSSHLGFRVVCFSAWTL